ncbi:MAG TPA: hypothetical protein VMV49_08985, partial [Candidatus Deferrimicrobium sp.]|nr:hypothetical protein [Candidatus Deferrimicrobium sp.]
FGIAITVISGILIFISTRWVVANIINIVEHTASPGLIVIYAIQLSLVAVILAMQIKALIGGIRLIKYYQGGA